MAEATEAETTDAEANQPTGESPEPVKRGKTVHGEAANAGHRVLAPDDAEVEAYLETALKAPAPDRSADDRPAGGDPTPRQTVVVLDFGSQFAQLIARRVRELHVYSELIPHDTPWAEIEARNPKAIILSGGPNSVYDADAPKPDPAVWSGRIPVLGICYGAQLMALELGGDVLPMSKREYGPASVTITDGNGLFDGLDREQPVWMSHGDSITRLPEGFTSTAQTDSTAFAGLQSPARNLYGIQFHPEVVHTPRGRDVLRNFVVGIAGATQSWTPASFIDQSVAEIRRRVDEDAARTGSDGLVICALSGGVDSAVAAALVALKGQVEYLFRFHIQEPQPHGAMSHDSFQMSLATATTKMLFRVQTHDGMTAFPVPLNQRIAAEADPITERPHPDHPLKIALSGSNSSSHDIGIIKDSHRDGNLLLPNSAG
jgi:GMP synthase (glutamine-hydrolysing) A subunit